MAESENVPGPSGDKSNNRKRKQHSLDEVLHMLDSDSSGNLCDDIESEDSLDNDSDNDSQRVRTGDVDISSLLNNTDSEDRADLDTRHELDEVSDSDSDYSVSRSDIDNDDSDNSAEIIAAPASVPRGRGRGRTAVRRGVRSERGGRGRGTRGRGQTRVTGGIRNIDESSFYIPDKQQPEIPTFTATPGIEVVPEGNRPIDFYRLYVTDEFLDLMVVESNRYAAQTIRQAESRGPLKKYSRLRSWSDVDKDTMEQFIGLQLLTGLVDKPTIESYWATNPNMYSPMFSYVMPRNRFQEILRFWHINDNNNEPQRDAPNRDRLYKLRPAIEHFQGKFESVYTPEKDVAIDESLLLWKGQLVFKQYIPLKRASFGIKIYNVCESSGYTYRFHIYAGKEDPTYMIETSIPDDAKHLTMTEKVVVFMTLPLLDKGYHLYMDNWYSGHHLYLYMKERQTVCCGTIRENRCPKPVRELQLENGRGMKALRSGPVLYVKWKSSKIVYMVSTIHDESTRMVHRRGRNEQVEKPSCVVSYNSNMGSVDRADQMLQPYDATRKTRRWYKKVLLHLLQISLLNSYIVYNKTPGVKKLDFFTFQQSVITDLLFGKSVRAPTMRQLQHEDLVRLKERHFPHKIPQTEKSHSTSRKCKVCTSRGKRKETCYMCEQCPSKPSLCAWPCFEIYHTVRKYTVTPSDQDS